MKNKQKTVDEYIQILLDKNGYISKHIPIELIPKGHPAWKRYFNKISEEEYEQTLQETDEILEIYKDLSMLFYVLSYEGFEEDYILRVVKYYEKEIEKSQNKSDYEIADLYMDLAFWSKKAFSFEYGKYTYNSETILGYYDKALSLYESSEQADETDIAYVYRQKGCFTDKRNENENSSEIAIEYYERAIELYKKVLPENDSTIANIYLDIADAYGYEPQAKEYCEKALAILPENHEIRTKAYNILGGIDFLAAPEAAIDYHKQELDYEQPYWDLVVVYDNIASSAYRARQYDESLYYAEKLIELCKKLCSFPNKTSVGSELEKTYLQMALIYDYGYSDYDKAKYYYMQIIEAGKKRFGRKGVYDTHFIEYIDMARLSEKYEDYDEAISIYNTLIEYLETRKVVNFQKLYNLFKYKAELYTILERTEEAYEAMAKSKEYERISKELGE